MRHIHAGPFRIHHLMSVSRLGVITLEHKSYKQVTCPLIEKQLELHNLNKECLIAGRMVIANADTLSANILAQVQVPSQEGQIISQVPFK